MFWSGNLRTIKNKQSFKTGSQGKKSLLALNKLRTTAYKKEHQGLEWKNAVLIKTEIIP